MKILRIVPPGRDPWRCRSQIASGRFESRDHGGYLGGEHLVWPL
jgi:hypothetical protein